MATITVSRRHHSHQAGFPLESVSLCILFLFVYLTVIELLHISVICNTLRSQRWLRYKSHCCNKKKKEEKKGWDGCFLSLEQTHHESYIADFHIHRMGICVAYP